jgi:hypothetical protein
MNINEKLAANLEVYNENRARIKNLKTTLPELGIEVDVSSEAKRKYLADLYRKHAAEHRRLAEQKIEEVNRSLEERRAEAFRPGAAGSDRTAVTMSMRDALDRLEGVTSPDELSRKLEQAHELGDEVMAKAILRKGYELGELGGERVVGSYLERYPDELKTWSSFMDAAEEFNRVEAFGVGFAPDRPPELDGGGSEMVSAGEMGAP